MHVTDYNQATCCISSQGNEEVLTYHVAGKWRARNPWEVASVPSITTPMASSGSMKCFVDPVSECVGTLKSDPASTRKHLWPSHLWVPQCLTEMSAKSRSLTVSLVSVPNSSILNSLKVMCSGHKSWII